jgi:hypothetical protein
MRLTHTNLLRLVGVITEPCGNQILPKKEFLRNYMYIEALWHSSGSPDA